VNNVAEGSMSLRMLDRMERDTAASGLTPEAVAKRVHALIISSKRPLRVPMDKARALSIVKRLAPQAVIDRMIAGLL
jgi:hypothetical protein